MITRSMYVVVLRTGQVWRCGWALCGLQQPGHLQSTLLRSVTSRQNAGARADAINHNKFVWERGQRARGRYGRWADEIPRLSSPTIIMAPRISQEDHDQILQLFKSGRTIEEISHLLFWLKSIIRYLYSNYRENGTMRAPRSGLPIGR